MPAPVLSNALIRTAIKLLHETRIAYGTRTSIMEMARRDLKDVASV
jgi:hypothetical protein